jgi:hypothetical protein
MIRQFPVGDLLEIGPEIAVGFAEGSGCDASDMRGKEKLAANRFRKV